MVGGWVYFLPMHKEMEQWRDRRERGATDNTHENRQEKQKKAARRASLKVTADQPKLLSRRDQGGPVHFPVLPLKLTAAA